MHVHVIDVHEPKFSLSTSSEITRLYQIHRVKVVRSGTHMQNENVISCDLKHTLTVFTWAFRFCLYDEFIESSQCLMRHSTFNVLR